MNPVISLLLAFSVFLAGCQGDDGPEAEPEEVVEDTFAGRSIPSGQNATAIRFDDGITDREPLVFELHYTTGQGSVCTAYVDDDPLVCTAEHDRFDMGSHLVAGNTYGFTANLRIDREIGGIFATTFDLLHENDWAEWEADSVADGRVMNGTIARTSTEPIEIEVGQFPGHEDVDYTLTIEVELQQQFRPEIPVLVDVDRSATTLVVETPVPIRAWDGKDTFLGRLEPSEGTVVLNLTGIDAAGGLVFQFTEATEAAFHVVQDPSKEASLRVLARSITRQVETTLNGAEGIEWQFTLDSTPLSVGIYAGKEGGLEAAWTSLTSLALINPDGEPVAEGMTGCGLCIDSYYDFWADPGEIDPAPGTYTGRIGGSPEPMAANTDVGHILMEYVR